MGENFGGGLVRACGNFKMVKGSGNVLMCGRIKGHKGKHRCVCGCGLRWEIRKKGRQYERE